jgi:hypothetical protein
MQGILTTFESRLTRYQALEQQLRATSGNAGQPVELNVGGTRFHTTVGTLCQEPSYLQGMFSGYLSWHSLARFLHIMASGPVFRFQIFAVTLLSSHNQTEATLSTDQASGFLSFSTTCARESLVLIPAT